MEVGYLVDDSVLLFSLSELNCADMIWTGIFSVVVFSAAHVGFQPQQSDQEEQRAGEPDGQADPDVSTCGGKASAAFIITALYIISTSVSSLYSL